jgi:hypothetical protein
MIQDQFDKFIGAIKNNCQKIKYIIFADDRFFRELYEEEDRDVELEDHDIKLADAIISCYIDRIIQNFDKIKMVEDLRFSTHFNTSIVFS